MSWLYDPFFWMGLVNVCSGLFSAIAGHLAIRATHASFPDWEQEEYPDSEQKDASNPWQYFLGGLIAALVGIGNWFQLSLATWGTVGFIATSIYDGWFGPGSKDWRFFTLNAYIVVQTAMVIWSTQIKSLISLP